MKHLDGPWTVEYTGVSTLEDFNIETATIRAGHLVVAEVECHHPSIAAVEANATLIAAAPDMLEVLQFIVNFNGSTGGLKSLVAEFKFRAAAAIAKATGEKA